MNKVDTEYFRLLNLILNEGRVKHNRTGIDTIGVFGAQAKFNIDMNAFPVLTTKKVFTRGIIHELLWFIKGDTNIKYLVDNDVHIWDEWAYKRYADTNISDIPDNDLEATSPLSGFSLSDVNHLSMSQFIERIKDDSVFASKWGELGEGTYGGMWRAFPYHYTTPQSKVDITAKGYPPIPQKGAVDQLQKLIGKLKTNPDDRRMIVSAWHPYWVDHCALPPCHCMFHFNTEELTLEERWKYAVDNKLQRGLSWSNLEELPKCLDEIRIPRRRLNCLLYQRSNDVALGTPFNITSYCLLTAMIAHCVNMIPGIFTHSMGDLHLYTPHLNGIKEQLAREPKQLPKLWLNPNITSLFDFKYDDIKILDYDCHPSIKFDVAV
jgi:thymidylate synthase